jgi:hypothetical protein
MSDYTLLLGGAERKHTAGARVCRMVAAPENPRAASCPSTPCCTNTPTTYRTDGCG